MTGRAMVVRGDARSLPLPDESVDIIVTSPPYFALRSYTDGGEHYDGQIGSEATPAEFLAALWACTREWVRVLKPSGSLFVNLGDKYATTCPPGSGGSGERSRIQQTHPGSYTPTSGRFSRPDNGAIRPKSLIGVPWRYAIGCIDDLGLILRAEIVWSKPNGLPESVTDRVRRSHENWFHFTREPRYYSAVDEIREPHTAPTRTAGATAFGGRNASIARTTTGDYDGPNPLGKLPGSVWTVPTEPLTVPAEMGVDHFAAFPTEWPRRIIAGWSPPGICVECGEGRRPVAAGATVEDRKGRKQRIVDLALDGAHGPDGRGGERWKQSVTITGYACACPEPTVPTRPAVVLDPFGGTGTTALVARALGRIGITVDLSLDYCRLARWRTTDPGELAKAMRVAKPPAQVAGQATLFEEAAS